jgi:hypothetical protein
MGGLRGTLTGCVGAALLLCAACDLVENRKFSPADFANNGGGYYTGLGGYSGTVITSGPGGSPGKISLDAGGYGGYGFGGAGGFPDAGSQCILDQTGGCIQNCYTAVTTIYPPLCDPGSRVYFCAGGMAPRYQCPPGSCGSQYQYCCDSTTGTLSVPFCSASGLLNACTNNGQYTADTVCIPNQFAGISDCLILNGATCSSTSFQCTSGRNRCYCDGMTFRWSCTSGGLGLP